MKKILLLLLCLVITVSSLGISVHAEGGKARNQGGSIVSLLVKNRTQILNLLAKYGIVFSAQPNQTQPKPDVPSKEENTNTDLHAYELRVIELVNAERSKYGLKALKASTELSNGARQKSLDMHNNGYFAHNSPTYGSPFDMMKSLGITYRTAGENIAKGYQTPEAVVKAWMNSEGHRANILNASYTEIGVGYIADGSYYTQWFRG